MTKTIIILICLLSFFLMCFKLFENSPQKIPKDEQAINKLLKQIAGSLSKNHNMHPSATIVSMPSGIIKLLGLNFQICGPLTKDEIRKILVYSAQEFVTCVNGNFEVRPYLEVYPFKIGNIDINLFIVDKDHIGVDDPHIGIAGIKEDKLDYLTLVTTDISRIKDRYVESYEDALKAMEQ